MQVPFFVSAENASAVFRKCNKCNRRARGQMSGGHRLRVLLDSFALSHVCVSCYVYASHNFICSLVELSACSNGTLITQELGMDFCWNGIPPLATQHPLETFLHVQKPTSSMSSMSLWEPNSMMRKIRKWKRETLKH